MVWWDTLLAVLGDSKHGQTQLHRAQWGSLRISSDIPTLWDTFQEKQKQKKKTKKSGIKIYTTADMFWQILSQFVFCVSSLCFFNSFMKHDCWNPLGHNSFPEEKDFWNASQGHSGDNFSAEDCEDFHARAATEGASSWNLLLIQILDDFQRVPSN